MNKHQTQTKGKKHMSTTEERLAIMEKELAATRRELTAAKKPNAGMKFFRGLGAVIMTPVDNVMAKGEAILEAKHYETVEEQEIANEVFEMENKLRVAKGLKPLDRGVYDDNNS